MLCNFQLESGCNVLFFWVLRLIIASLVLFISMHTWFLHCKILVDYEQTPLLFADIDSKGVSPCGDRPCLSLLHYNYRVLLQVFLCDKTLALQMAKILSLYPNYVF